MTQPAEVHTFDAPVGAGRIDAWLAVVLPQSRSQIQTLLRAGDVTVDGHSVRPAFRLQGGEQVIVRIPPPEPCDLVAQDIPVPILHIDDHVIVVDKPAGIVVHPSKGHPDGTLVNALLHLLNARPPRRRRDSDWHDDLPRPGLVHRLDKGTSGVMVVARTPTAHAHLSDQFAAHTVERRYAALVWGDPRTNSGKVDAALGRHPQDRLKFAVVPTGKHAVTHWMVLGRATYAVAGDAAGGRLALVECRLETGRTHQVRVHMHHIGHPLVGDTTYYRSNRKLPTRLTDKAGAPEQQLLHAWMLGFVHPATNRLMRFSSPLRPEFQSMVDALGLKSPVA